MTDDIPIPELDDAEIDALEKRERKAARELRKMARTTSRAPAESRAALRKKLRIFYDLQQLRIQAAGRGAPKGVENPVALTDVDVAVLDARAAELKRLEAAALADVKDHLAGEKLWTEVIGADRERFKGFAETMAAVLISEVDIARCDTASKLWAFAGLAPVPARRCKACKDEVVAVSGRAATSGGPAYRHRFNRQVKCSAELSDATTFASSAAARPEKGTKLPFNRWLKTKMVGVAATNIVRAGGGYRKFYDDYKHRLASSGRGMSDGHRHRMALRYMIKMLLLDVWKEWRAIEGLPVREPYQEQYLGHRHAS